MVRRLRSRGMVIIITRDFAPVIGDAEERQRRRKQQDLPELAAEGPTLEAMIDETLEESFPASDPPAWGSAAARVKRMEGERFA